MLEPCAIIEGIMRIKCPICGSVTTWEENPSRPFCSERCKLQDLGNWASQKYSIEGTESVPGEGDFEEDNTDE